MANFSAIKSEKESLADYLDQQEKRFAAFKNQAEEQEKRELEEQRLENRQNEAREKQRAAKEEELRAFKRRIVYSADLTETICRRVSNGEMLNEICTDVTMPEMGTVMSWLEDKEYTSFQKEYETARKRRLSLFEDQLITIADNSTNDYVDRLNAKTGESFRVLDQEALARSKMRLDMRLRHLKAFNPQRWGDNPDTAAALRDNQANQRPSVIINMIAAPVKPDTSAITIEHKPTIDIAQSNPVREKIERLK